MGESTTGPTDEMAEAAAIAVYEHVWSERSPLLPPWAGLTEREREYLRGIQRVALRAALAVAPAPSEDDERARQRAGRAAEHLDTLSRLLARDGWGQHYIGALSYAVHVLVLAARRSPVSLPEDVAALLAEHDALRDDLANKPGPQAVDAARRVLSMLDRMAAALRAPVPVETVTAPGMCGTVLGYLRDGRTPIMCMLGEHADTDHVAHVRQGSHG